MLGPPGLVLAVLVLWLLPDVTRSGGVSQVGESPRFAAVVRDLVAQPEFRHLASGAALVVLVGYGVASFLAPFLQRQHHLPVAQAGLITGLINGLAAGLGTLLGGQLSDRLAPRSKAWLAWLPAAAAMAGAPLLMSGSFSTSTNVAVAGMMVGTLCVYTYLAPAFAAVYGLAPAGKRATATAVFYLVINLVGTGLGPPLIGALSDGFAHRAFTRGVHDGVGFDIACGLAKQADQHPACAAAMATGLGQSLFWVSGLLYWAAFHFILAGRHLKRNGRGPGKGASSF